MPTSTSTTTNTTTTTTTVTTVTPNNNSNWNWQVWTTIAYILAVSSIFIYLFVVTYKKVDNSNKYAAVYWPVIDSSMKVGVSPIWFVLDIRTDSIKTLKPIDDDDKKVLSGLVNDTATYRNSYVAAVNSLAFESNLHLKSPYLMVLFLTSICGAIGVLLRTANNLIGVACWKNDFNFEVWWPWYFLRPFMGMILGPILFIIIEGKILPFNSYHTYSNVLVIAISVLAGFGAEDLLNALRSLSKKVFSIKE